MSIVKDPTRWDSDRLASLIREQSELLRQLSREMREQGGAWRDPGSRLTAEELVEDVLRLGVGALARGSDRADPTAHLGDIANVQYGAMLAAIDLLKSHVDLPKVPRRPSAGPPSPAPGRT